jgi:hypothetical protein
MFVGTVILGLIAHLGTLSLFGGLFAAVGMYWWWPGNGPNSPWQVGPSVETRDLPTLDVSDELLDLVKLASQRINRELQSRGRADAIVMYEDHAGDARIRRIEGPQDEMILARARQAARGVDPQASRIVLAVSGSTHINGKRRPVVYYEAAELGFSDRTLAFMQRYRRKLWPMIAHVQGRPFYIGETSHSLRFSSPREG